MTEKEGYSVQQNKVIINNQTLKFDFPVKEFIKIADMLIVMLGYDDKVIPIEENVFGLSLPEAKIKWQIEKRKYPNGGYTAMRCPFIGISFGENKLRLHNWCSANLIVDPVTGKVLSEEETR
jgi:hypothetical protein